MSTDLDAELWLTMEKSMVDLAGTLAVRDLLTGEEEIRVVLDELEQTLKGALGPLQSVVRDHEEARDACDRRHAERGDL